MYDYLRFKVLSAFAHRSPRLCGYFYSSMAALVYLLPTSVQAELIDLEKKTQDFVLETKKIEIPGFPDAFNASIVRWNNALLLSFRFRDPITLSTDGIGFVWLDEEFNIVGDPQILDVRLMEPMSRNSMPSSWAQDPRLIVVAERLYIVYSNIYKSLLGEKRRMLVAELQMDETNLYIENPQWLLNFEGADKTFQEKNWVPFDYQGNLLLSYSLNPHVVFYPIPGTANCELLASTNAKIKWHWGTLRGGTQALIVGDEYLAFFHSSKNMTTIQSAGKEMQHYFMGAYTFNTEMPFEITRISPEPIVGKNFYNGPVHKTWKPLRVVFPCGYVFDDNYIWVSYGRQDHEVWIVKLDRKGLYKSLVPVTEHSIEKK